MPVNPREFTLRIIVVEQIPPEASVPDTINDIYAETQPPVGSESCPRLLDGESPTSGLPQEMGQDSQYTDRASSHPSSRCSSHFERCDRQFCPITRWSIALWNTLKVIVALMVQLAIWVILIIIKEKIGQWTNAGQDSQLLLIAAAIWLVRQAIKALQEAITELFRQSRNEEQQRWEQNNTSLQEIAKSLKHIESLPTDPQIRLQLPEPGPNGEKPANVLTVKLLVTNPTSFPPGTEHE